MYFKSKQETCTKFTIRNFHKVPTPEEIFSGKLRPRVRLRLRSHAGAKCEIMYMRQQARSNVSKHQRTDIQKLKSVA
jgi:hypothetical protein